MGKREETEYRGFRGAGIRLTQEEDPRLLTHSSEYELPSLYAYHMFDKAHLVMMAESGMLSRKDAVSMLRELRKMEEEGVEKVRVQCGGGMHSGEQYLIKKLGEELGGKLHLARSSGDLLQVGNRIRMRDHLLLLLEGINQLQDVFLGTARKHLDTVMPGYTHGQHAQPTTFAHYLVAYASALQRDFERFEQTYHRINRSPAGAAIMTGSNFPVDRHRVSDLLGFEAVLRNTIDAILTNDSTLEVFANLALLHNDLARWAMDFQLWCSNEFNMIDIPDRFCVSSSIMMQKKNPWIFENIKGSGSHTMGGLMIMFLAHKGPTGLPMGDRRYSMNAFWTAMDYAIRDLSLLAEMLPETKINTTLMKERAGAFWAQATDVGAVLVKEKGLPWRTAHQIVGILVRYTYERGIKPSDIDTKLLDEAAIEYMGKPVGLNEESLRRALDPREFIWGRTLYGGTAPREVSAQIDELAEMLDRNRGLVAKARISLKEASDKLELVIDTFLASDG